MRWLQVSQILLNDARGGVWRGFLDARRVISRGPALMLFSFVL